MGWKAYKLVYQAKSPIHIGYHKLGFIQRTRYYITGRNMWGAVTANLARSLQMEKGESLNKHYKDVGQELLNKDIFVSYFYPALEINNLLLPEFTSNGLRYGKGGEGKEYTADRLESVFIHSFGQTAIEPDSNTAEDETLHETEYIAPVVEKDEKQNPVYFVGYIFVKDGVEYKGKNWADMKSAIREINVGGERKYGFGRLALQDEPSDTENDVFGFEFVSDGDNPVIKLGKDKPIPAHIEIDNPLKLKGDVEPLVGREWGKSKDGKKKGAGQKISEACICWVPGSILLEDKPLKIKPYGILSI